MIFSYLLLCHCFVYWIYLTFITPTCRLNIPLDAMKYLPGGELRIGSFRQTTQTKNNPAFGCIISSDTRLLIGINVNDLLEEPYISPWLQELRQFYTNGEGVKDEKVVLNFARFFFANELAVRINAQDPAALVKPSMFCPWPRNAPLEITRGCSVQINLHPTGSTPPLASSISASACLSPFSTDVVFMGTGEKTLNCRVLLNVLAGLGVRSFSVLRNGGNVPLNEVLDTGSSSMQLWTALAE
jgi:hypothetical protein